jgi:hypothetical protein
MHYDPASPERSHALTLIILAVIASLALRVPAAPPPSAQPNTGVAEHRR